MHDCPLYSQPFAWITGPLSLSYCKIDLVIIVRPPFCRPIILTKQSIFIIPQTAVANGVLTDDKTRGPRMRVVRVRVRGIFVFCNRPQKWQNQWGFWASGRGGFRFDAPPPYQAATAGYLGRNKRAVWGLALGSLLKESSSFVSYQSYNGFKWKCSTR